ncbi:MAG: hypothetical protein V5A88_01545 [Candidatus Thermoplasmatota archaeon]
MSKTIARKKLRRIINSYILAQEDPYDERKLKLLQKYLHSKKIGDINIKVLKRYIKRRLAVKKQNKRLKKMENELFTKDEGSKNIKYGSGFCPKCGMYKDYQKECPYCNKLELTR